MVLVGPSSPVWCLRRWQGVGAFARRGCLLGAWVPHGDNGCGYIFLLRGHYWDRGSACSLCSIWVSLDFPSTVYEYWPIGYLGMGPDYQITSYTGTTSEH